jgi:hypothetical protein
LLELVEHASGGEAPGDGPLSVNIGVLAY